jgi:hypothetical protein
MYFVIPFPLIHAAGLCKSGDEINESIP